MSFYLYKNTLKGNGYEILFDGIKVYISMEPVFANKIRGLCGTYSFKSSDDFTTPEGFIESDANAFADTYKMSTDTCIAPTQTHPCESSISV